MEGIAPYVIPPRFSLDIEQLRDSILEDQGRISDEILQLREDDILDQYWVISDVMHRPPQLRNTSGEHLCFHKLVYSHSSFKDVVSKLADLTRIKEEVTRLAEAADDPAAAEEGVHFKWLSKNNSNKLDGQTVFGDFYVERSQFTVTVNSTPRANRIKKEIEKRLGDRVNLKLDVIEDFDSQRLGETQDHADEDRGLKFDDLPPEAQQEFREQAAERRARWFDRPIPILGNQTPRQAATSTEGRKKLEHLIETYNFSRRQSDGSSMADLLNPTESEIRKELGL